MEVSPFVGVFGAVEAIDGVHRQKITFGAFARHFGLRRNVGGFVADRIGWALDAAGSVIEVEVVSYVLEEARAFAFE